MREIIITGKVCVHLIRHLTGLRSSVTDGKKEANTRKTFVLFNIFFLEDLGG